MLMGNGSDCVCVWGRAGQRAGVENGILGVYNTVRGGGE